MAQGGWNPPPGGYAPPPGGHAPPPGGFAPPPGGHGPPPGGYAPPQQHHYQPPPVSATAAQSKGFFAGLFDFSFENLVALKVIKVLYGLFLLALAGGILFGLGGAVLSIVNGQILAGLGMLVVLPVAALLYLILGRVYFELIVLAFKIAEDADEIAKNTRK
ncbi:MAG: DUF4282 domain-containing protein [Myxococcales bacterium]